MNNLVKQSIGPRGKKEGADGWSHADKLGQESGGDRKEPIKGMGSDRHPIAIASFGRVHTLDVPIEWGATDATIERRAMEIPNCSKRRT
jgi:hypothetical protein